jgi:phosphoglycerate dehydrogenase-like enzyme
MRERTPLPRSIIDRLPRLKMIASTGPFNASIDMSAVADHGIHVAPTGGTIASTVELTWALILAASRNLVVENTAVRTGGWQTSVGRELNGCVLGVLGLGRIGIRVARIGDAFGMDVIAWSQNLTKDAAAEAGARYVSKDELFGQADVLTIHLKLSERSRNLVGAAELAVMKPTALLVNTSRQRARRSAHRICRRSPIPNLLSRRGESDLRLARPQPVRAVRPAAEAKARSSRSMSDPAGWYTSSVTSRASSPAIFAGI